MVRPSALGDVARTVPCLVTLRHAMPDAHIDWLVQEDLADVVRHHPMLDGVVTFPRESFRHTWRRPRALLRLRSWLRQLRNGRHDIAVDLQGLLRSGFFTYKTRAARRIGFANAREHAAIFYNRKHHVDDAQHAADRMLGLLEAEGYAPVRDLRLYVGDADRAWADAWRAGHGCDGDYACIAPGAKWRCKAWPLERYAAMAQRLLRSGAAGRRIVLIGTAAEAQAWRAFLDEHGRGELAQHVLTPPTTVGQMMALIARCRLFIGNDSGPLHVAVGLGRPVVALFGPTDPALVGPYQRDAFVARPDEPPLSWNAYRRHRDDQTLIAKVTADQVWEKVLAALRE